MNLIKNIAQALFFSLVLSMTGQAASNPCKSIPGHWQGTANIAHWLIGHCVYHTSWQSELLGNSQNFILKLTATRSSGGIFCPRKGRKKLQGICENGVITILTKHGNLNGEVAPKKGHAHGKIYLIPGIGARITIDFTKESS